MKRKELNMRYQQIFVGLFLLTLVVGLAGCFSAKPDDIQAFLKPGEAQVTADDYLLQPPDQVTVISSKVPELAGTTRSVGHTQTIRPDGYVSFETIGEVQVAGKTPRQVAEIIGERLKKLYTFASDYPVDVRVTRNESKYYYIIGMIANPGAQIYTGRETTLSAIAKAVPNVQAWEEETQIIRPSLALTEKPKIFKLNFKRMIEHGDMSGNVLLQEGDIIYVPPTILASIGLTLQEIVGPISGGASIVSDVQTIEDN
jgi:protein involved in polysaccharide export with SLBB domain